MQNGSLYGFEYELLSDFAAKHHLQVDVVVADSQEELFQLLQDGKGDIIAASLPDSVLDTDQDIQFTRTYHYASPIIVGRDEEAGIIDLRDLAGKRIILTPNNPYWEYMSELQQQGIAFQLFKARPDIKMADVLEKIALGHYDLSIVGSHQIKTEFLQELGLAAQFALSEPLPHRWAIRSNNKQLRQRLKQLYR